MQRRYRSLLIKMVPVLLPVAIIGYLAGGGLSRPTPTRVSSAPQLRTLAASNAVVLDYPSYNGWNPVSGGAPRIPGLPLANAFLLAPPNKVTQVSLITGQLANGESSSSSLFPALFLAHLSRPPQAEVVSLSDSQAYRYSQLSFPGLNRHLTLYLIPYTSGPTTAIICYAPPAASFSSYLRTCEQIAAQLTLRAEAQSKALLTPDVAYAHQISAVIGGVNELRVDLRPAMHLRASYTTMSGLAKRLAGGLAGAAQSLSALQPPAAAELAHTALSKALLRGSEAYFALAAAASAGSAARYGTARTEVYEAEVSIGSALGGFALIGYE